MKTNWIAGLKGREKESMVGAYERSLLVRKKLKEIIEGKLESEAKSARSKEGYDSPNWAYKQADTQGYYRAMHEILSLIIDK